MKAPDRINFAQRSSSTDRSVAQLAERLFDDRSPLVEDQAGAQADPAGRSAITAERLDAACRRALACRSHRREPAWNGSSLPGSGTGGHAPTTATHSCRPLCSARFRLRPCCWRSIMTRITELTPLLKRLFSWGPWTATLPERIALASEGNSWTTHHSWRSSSATRSNRRAQRRIELRLNGAGFEETCRLEDFDWSASITLDRRHAGRRFLPGVSGQARARAFGGTCWSREELPGSGPGLLCRPRRTHRCASSTPTTSSRPWPKPGSITR